MIVELDLFLTGCSYAGQLSHEPLAPNFARISRAWKARSQVEGSIRLSKVSKPRLFLLNSPLLKNSQNASNAAQFLFS